VGSVHSLSTAAATPTTQRSSHIQNKNSRERWRQRLSAQRRSPSHRTILSSRVRVAPFQLPPLLLLLLLMLMRGLQVSSLILRARLIRRLSH
jgi:hypothetical protein